jgi:opacity protein-like surface antigen
MKKTMVALMAAVLVASAASGASAADIDDLKREVEELKGQVKSLSAPVKEERREGDGDSYLKKTWDRTRFGGYGELDYIFRRENGNGNGGNRFDPHRFVLYVNSPLADWVTLNAELEWEHGGVKDELNSEGELSGEVNLEQAFLDFKLFRPLTVRTGVVLVPLGAINLYHEPTNYNSTERPELDQFLIPSTWSEMGAGILGAAGERVNYQLFAVNGLDGSKFSAKKGIRDGRQNFNEDVNNGKAVTGRLEVRPCTNLYTNVSFYYGNSAPSGRGSAYTTIAAFDGKYSIGNFDLAGEYVQIYQDNPAALGVADIGHTMSGYWVEGAWHMMPKSWKSGKLADADAVLFARYSEFDTQKGRIGDPATASGRFDRNYTTVGLVFKPVTTVAIKADYQIYDDHRAPGETPLDNDKFQISVGFVF